MAMQLSFDEEGRSSKGGGIATVDGAGRVRGFAQFAGVMHRLRASAREAMERLRSAQARNGKRKQMRLIESLALGNRRQILLVACDNQRYLVGVGPDSVGSILAMEPGAGSRERLTRGPELVRRRGREANLHAGLNANLESSLDQNGNARSKVVAEAGLELWQ